MLGREGVEYPVVVSERDKARECVKAMSAGQR